MRASTIIVAAVFVVVSTASLVPCEAVDDTTAGMVDCVSPAVSAAVSSTSNRVIVVERGWDPIYHEVFVQWLREPIDRDDQREVIATKRVDVLSGGSWRVHDPVFVDPTSVRVTVCFRFSEKKHEITIKMTSDQKFELIGDLTVREEEI